ncbi:MAG TPA: CRISPR-associated helicase/endonuclease Cas3 [Candidatus Atribacteria bacterium]|nr:CRISPR-associated helicase/endonuclease Cas3 [Candidatus Atribacteria bacterium]
MSSLSKVYSHPDKLLVDHLQKVGDLCRQNLSLKKLNLDGYIDFNILKDIFYLVGVAHDFGKATTYFQEYLKEKNESKKMEMKNKVEIHHSLISALFTYYVVKEYLLTKDLLSGRYYQYLPVISFLVVKRHHGNLDDALDEVILDSRDDKILEKQVNAVDFKIINNIYNKFFSKIDFKFDYNLFRDNILNAKPIYIYNEIDRYEKNYIRDLNHQEKKLITYFDEEDTLFYYFITMLLYSLLLDADKTDAANLQEIKRIKIDKDIVDNYKLHLFKDINKKKKEINKIRNEIYNETISSLGRLNLEKDKILSLNVPTGTGKTLASLSFALKLKAKIEQEKKYKPRIIYSLPYLSIIDQNFAIFEDVFKFSLKGKTSNSNLLLKHHHLSDINYTASNIGKEEFENVSPKDIGKDLLLIEGWNSEVIVTTFFQFFYSLISNRNKSIRKFHNIVNSIVILDEIQAIPHCYWLLLNKIIHFLAEKFNIYFILVTATQPLLFDEKEKEIKPLIKDKEKYFKALNRVNLEYNPEPLSLNDFQEILEENLCNNPNKDFLIVLNTINSSLEIYNFICQLELEDTEIYYLSTNVIPKERLRRIKKSREKTKKRKIIISTQLIEAGVDLDVDIVYRDFAPLDSINQVAGRCNRNFSQNKGLIKLFILKEEEKKKEYYRYIYDSFIISKTKDVLREASKKQIEEKDFLSLNNLYFDKVNQGKADDKAKEILEEVKKLNFGELNKFKLIKDTYKKIDIFVEVDKKGKEIYQKYKDLYLIKDLFKRKNEFLKIKKNFYDYVISVPYNYAADFVTEDKGMGHISLEEIKQNNYYDPETGFKREEKSGGGTLIY